MSFITRLFSPEAATKAIDAVTKGIDHANFTPQEQAELKIRQLESLAPFKVVQRILMASICFVWVTLIMQYCIAIWLDAELVKTALIELIQSEFVWGPTLAGFGLYLGGGLVESAKRNNAVG